MATVVGIISRYGLTIVTGPGKTGLIYTKYTCLNYGTYLLFCVCYLKSVSFIEFLMDLCIYDDILYALWITDETLLHFKLSNSGQILHLYKTCFSRPGHNCRNQAIRLSQHCITCSFDFKSHLKQFYMSKKMVIEMAVW